MGIIPSKARPRRRLKPLAVGLFGVCAIAALVLRGLNDFDLVPYETQTVKFQSFDDTLTGSLFVPPVPNPAIALFVHGDGPQGRLSGDGYNPMIKTFLDAGIGVFTWDKPGVGESGGDWLDQSLDDRAIEATNAYDAIKALPSVADSRIGFLGFSQAGWVVPQAAQQVQADFVVLIGAALNWRRQGAYFTRAKLEQAGMSAEQAAETAEIELAQNDQTFLHADGPFEDPRLAFVARNYAADAQDDLRALEQPVLAVWGADDLNVEATYNAQAFKTLLPKPEIQRVEIISDASHGLLRAPWFNYQLTSEWPLTRQISFLIAGRYAFAGDSLNTITQWIKQTDIN